MLYRRGVLLAASLALVSSVRADSVVISDSFNGPRSAIVESRWPDTANLPGRTWEVISVTKHADGKFEAPLDFTAGDPPPSASLYCAGQSSGAIYLPISSQGAYVKPHQFTISADLGGFIRKAHPLLGFYSAVPADPIDNFTGLELVSNGDHDPANGTLILIQNGVPSTSVKFTGPLNRGDFHHLSYDVDTATGAISNVSLQGSSSDYSVFHSTAFTDAATAYTGVGARVADRDNKACVDNFKIVALGNGALAPNTSPPAAPTGLAATRDESKWNAIRLNWKLSYGTYSVYRGTTPGGEAPTPIAAGIAPATYTDPNTDDATTYYYKVRATNPNGSSGDSNEAAFRPVNPLYRDRTVYPPLSLSWSTSTAIRQARGVYPHIFLPHRALVPTETGLLLTDDDGRTWTDLPAASGDKIGPICDIAFHPVLPGAFYIASQTKGVWTTTDNGKTFTQIGSKSNGMAADSVASLMLYPGDSAGQTLVAAHGDAAAGLSRSRDAGKTWEVVNTENHFRRIFGAGCNDPQFYLFGSTLKEPDIQSVYTCHSVGEYVTEVIRDVVPTDLVFAPVPWRKAGYTYVATSDSGLYRIDNQSQFGMAFNVDKLPLPGTDGWASVGVTWGPSPDVINLFLYDPTKLGLIISNDDLATFHASSDGLPVSPLTREGAVLHPNSNGTVCYAVANGGLSIGRATQDVPVVDFTPAAFNIYRKEDQDWRKLADEFEHFSTYKGSESDAARALCQRVPDPESLYRDHQVHVTARVAVKPVPPESVTIDLSRFAGSPNVPLDDDGLHGDGAAGDGIYGGAFLFLPDYHRPGKDDPEWRAVGPGRIAIGVTANYPDGTHRAAVGVENLREQLSDLFMWRDLNASLLSADGNVAAEPFRIWHPGKEPLDWPHQPPGDIALRVHIPKGPWAVHIKTYYNPSNIDGYAGLQLYLRLEAGQTPKELYLQLRDAPEFSPPTTTDRVPLLNGITLAGSYQRIAVPMSKVIGPSSPVQADHLGEFIISGDSSSPCTLIVDGLAAITTYPPVPVQ